MNGRSRAHQAIAVLFCSLFLSLSVVPAHADVMCDLMWYYFDNFPDGWWTIHSGDWVVEENHAIASHDQWSDGYWAISHVLADWNGNYNVYVDVSFGDLLAGKITIFMKVEGDFKGYAFTLDGDEDKIMLSKAKINDDGTVDNLGTLAEAKDIGLEADHMYSVWIDHSDKVHLYGSIDESDPIGTFEISHPNGGIAIGYTGAGSGHFYYICVNAMGLCFIRVANALDPFLPSVKGSMRPFLLIPLLVIGLIGIIHEHRTRSKRGP
ncbi:hypothetical protein ACFL4G_08760 [Thermodesulfobacteriota bacterium]